jgi:hypothetical protein
MEYIKILIGRFLVEANFLQALNLCQDIINAEDKPLATMQNKLDWIKENTTENLHIPFVIVETFISKNVTRPLNYSVEVPLTNYNPPHYKEYELMTLIVEMKRAYEQMRWIVTQIAKKYSIDIVFNKEEKIEIPVIE